MDHELKQRLIGAVVVTALCAIFIPMLFDDPVDNSGQLVSELTIPAPVESGSADRSLPTSADQVLKSTDPEPLSTETAGDTLDSTGATEEVTEEPAKQERSGESLYAESDGYSTPEEPVSKAEDNRSKSVPKQPFDTAQGKPLSTEAKSLAPKVQVKDTRVDQSAKFKKTAEMAKPPTAKDGGSAATGKESMQPMVKKPEKSAGSGLARLAPEVGRTGTVQSEIEPPAPAKVDGTKAGALTAPKQPNAAKSLAAAVAESKKPVVVPKETPKLVRWYVQIGSFSKKENATSLWESLREQGLPASLDTVQTDKGTSYRLRVGPELDGKKAAAMKARLDKQNIKAILVSE
jgi:DedD protein